MDGEDIKACNRFEHGRIVKFSSRQKSLEILSKKKKKLKNVVNDKFSFTPDSQILISEGLCPYYRGL